MQDFIDIFAKSSKFKGLTRLRGQTDERAYKALCSVISTFDENFFAPEFVSDFEDFFISNGMNSHHLNRLYYNLAEEDPKLTYAIVWAVIRERMSFDEFNAYLDKAEPVDREDVANRLVTSESSNQFNIRLAEDIRGGKFEVTHEFIIKDRTISKDEIAKFAKFHASHPAFKEITTRQNEGQDERAVRAIADILKDCGFDSIGVETARQIMDFLVDHGIYAEGLKTLYYDLAQGNGELADGVIQALSKGVMDFSDYDVFDRDGKPLDVGVISDIAKRLRDISPALIQFTSLEQYAEVGVE